MRVIHARMFFIFKDNRNLYRKNYIEQFPENASIFIHSICAFN